jgi:secondary thiamine-phosphate synthase enzyme
MYKLNIKTHSRTEFVEITPQIRDIIKEDGVESGICVVYVPHTTAGVIINEHADPDVVDDITAQLEKMVPQHAGYTHTEGNSAAHIKASLIGSSVMLIIQYGELALGTWQGVFFGEFDGPRNRSVFIKIIAD